MQALKRIGKSMEQALRLAKVNMLLRRRYGTRWPQTVRYPDAGFELSIDPYDWRATKKIAFDFARGRIDRNIRFWRDFVDHNRPALCLDIGANYGECLFSLAYAEHTQVLAVEANSRLLPFLERSRRAHPNAGQITIHNVAAADSAKDAVSLYVNSSWSGRSTALDRGEQAGATETIRVPQRTIDSLVDRQQAAAGPVVFKLDVEGYEPFVLQGMTQTISAAPLVIGYIEVDSDFLAAAGITLPELDELLAGFALYWPLDRGSGRLRPLHGLAELQQASGGQIHTDVIAVKGGDAGHGWLPPAWSLVA